MEKGKLFFVIRGEDTFFAGNYWSGMASCAYRYEELEEAKGVRDEEYPGGKIEEWQELSPGHFRRLRCL